MSTKNQSIIVASANPTKIQSALLGFQRMFPNQSFTAKGIKVPPGVSDQPMNDKETYQGAMNRAKNAQAESLEGDYWIGIEGGLTYNVAGKMEAYAWMVVLSKAFPNLIGKARTASFEIAPPIAALIHEGYELGVADDMVFEVSNSKQNSGGTGLLTEDVVHRTSLYEMAVIMALIPFKNSELYAKEVEVEEKHKLKETPKKQPYLKIDIEENFYLTIREPKHAEEQFALIDRNRAYLREWLPWVDKNKTVADSLANIEGDIRSYHRGNHLVLGIWFYGKLAGCIGLHAINHIHRQGFIGYWLGAEYQGNGIMTKACRAIIKHAFEELNLYRIEIKCAIGNAKSCAIPKRLGFQYEGTSKAAEWLYDYFVDVEIYGLLNES